MSTKKMIEYSNPLQAPGKKTYNTMYNYISNS